MPSCVPLMSDEKPQHLNIESLHFAQGDIVMLERREYRKDLGKEKVTHRIALKYLYSELDCMWNVS